jgi:endogenous inhibitor of DNA gyrase (YacG/DUF329 family)
MEEIIVIPNLRCYYCQVARDDERRERQLAERRERIRRAREEERLAAREFYEGRECRERRAAQEDWNRDRERWAAIEREDVQMGEVGPFHQTTSRIRELSQVVDDINAMFRANSADDIASYVNSSDSDSDSEGPHRNRRLSSIAIKYLLSQHPYPTEGGHACSICLEPFGQASGEVASSLPHCSKHPCGNICLTEWLQEHDTCPVCRHDYKREIAIALDIQDIVLRRT